MFNRSSWEISERVTKILFCCSTKQCSVRLKQFVSMALHSTALAIFSHLNHPQGLVTDGLTYLCLELPLLSRVHVQVGTRVQDFIFARLKCNQEAHNKAP